MGMNLIEKILARAAGRSVVRVGEYVNCSVDMTVLLDLQFAEDDRISDVIRLFDPSRVAIVMDHAVPAPSIRDAAGASAAREFARNHGVAKIFDIGSHGIVHEVIVENGLVRPGQVLACEDSHTCAAGAFGVAGRGLGPSEIIQILCTGEVWYRVPPTIKYDLIGKPFEGVSGKDIFLHIADKYGGATNHAVEFAGVGVETIPMNDRRTIATQGAELAADFTTFPTDDRCIAFLEGIGIARGDFSAVASDVDALYESVRTVDLGDVEPMVGLPGGVINNCSPASQFSHISVNQCFIGSCANGQLADLEIAARILQGRRVASGVRLIVTPASQKVYLEACRKGYVESLVAAGAVVTNSTCGACFGYSMGVVGPGEICLTSSTRNFKGRMGSPDADIYMASPATVAASAILGHIADPREITSS